MALPSIWRSCCCGRASRLLTLPAGGRGASWTPPTSLLAASTGRATPGWRRTKVRPGRGRSGWWGRGRRPPLRRTTLCANAFGQRPRRPRWARCVWRTRPGPWPSAWPTPRKTRTSWTRRRTRRRARRPRGQRERRPSACAVRCSPCRPMPPCWPPPCATFWTQGPRWHTGAWWRPGCCAWHRPRLPLEARLRCPCPRRPRPGPACPSAS